MNNFRSVGITLLALLMGLGSVASAQDRGPPDRNDRQAERRGPNDRNADRDDRHQGFHQRDNRDRRDYRANRDYGDFRDFRDHRDHRDYRADHDGRRGDPAYNQRGEWRGAGPNHDFRRGGYLPRQYRSQQYVVNDWRGHHLSSPPRGYYWVQTGSDYVLAAIATGVILQILLNN